MAGLSLSSALSLSLAYRAGSGGGPPPAVAPLRTATGTFTGTGAKQEIALPFVPDLVYVWAADQAPYWKNRTAWHGRSQRLDATPSAHIIGPNATDPVWLPFFEAKFSVEASYSVSAKVYRYAAIRVNGGDAVEETSIIGNALSGRLLDFTTRRSALVMGKRDSARSSVWATDGATDNPTGAITEGPISGAIAIRDAGVTLSNSVWVNENTPPALGEGIEYLSFINGEGVKVERITGNGAGSRVLTGHGKVAFVLDATRTSAGGAVVPQIVIDGQNGDGFNGTAPAAPVSLSSGSLTLPTSYNASGVDYIVLSLDDAGAAIVPEPVEPVTAKVGKTYGLATLSNTISVSGACSYEYYGKPGGTDHVIWSSPLLMFGQAADQGAAGSMNGGIYLWATDPDNNGWRGAVLRVMHTSYLARDRTGSNNTINTYNMNTGVMIRQGDPIHVVVTHNGSGKWRVYLNGKLIKEFNIDLNQAAYGNRVNGGGGVARPVYVNSANINGTIINRIGEIYRVRVWNSELTDAEATAVFPNSRDNTTWSGTAAASEWDFRTTLPTVVGGITLDDKRTGRRALPYFLPSSDASFAGDPAQNGFDLRVTTRAGGANGRCYISLSSAAPAGGTAGNATYAIRSVLEYGDATRIICRNAADTIGSTGTTIFDLTGTGTIDRTDTVTVPSGSTAFIHYVGVTLAGQFFTIKAQTEIVRIT